MRLHHQGDLFRKHGTIYGQRVSTRHTRYIRRAHAYTSQSPQFFLQQPRSGWMLVRFQRIAAHQFRKSIRLVRRRRPDGPHFVEHHRDARISDLPRRFRPSQTAADYMDGCRQDFSFSDQKVSRCAGQPAEGFVESCQIQSGRAGERR